MDLKESNQYLAKEWHTALTQDERADLNTQARTTQIIPCPHFTMALLLNFISGAHYIFSAKNYHSWT